MNSVNSVDLKNEIIEHLSVDDETVQQIIQLKKQKEGLEGYFETYPEDRESDRFNENLILVDRQLDHSRPYRIAIIGTTGVGKSSVANALLNRDLLLTKPARATTGTVLEIHQTAANDNEIAKPAYRNEQDIRKFLETNFINPFQVNIKTQPIDEKLKNAIEAAGTSSGNESDFKDTKKICVDIVDQFIRQPKVSESGEFKLNEESELSFLNELIDENSDINKNPETRQVGLIKSVFYSISPNAALDIPKTACLIDLPGLGATPLHDEIIRKNVDEADAVVFVFDAPNRVDRSTDEDLIRRIIEKGSINPEQMFLVFNKWDQVTHDSTGNNIESEVTEAAKDMAEKLGLNPKDKSWFFPVSAAIARLAQKQSENSEEGISDNYKTFAKHSGLGEPPYDPEKVLIATCIPELADALCTLGKNNVTTRIEKAMSTLNTILNTLEITHRSSETPQDIQDKLSDETDKSNSEKLDDMQEDMLKLVNSFKNRQLENRSDLKRVLELEFDIICESVNKQLQAACPDLWNPIVVDRDHISGRRIYDLNRGGFITQANIKVWDLLSDQLDDLVKETVEYHEAVFSTQEIRENLIAKGYNFQATKDAFPQQYIDERTKELRENLSQAIKRSAVSILCDPKYFFSEEGAGKQPEVEPEVQNSSSGEESNQQSSMNSRRAKLVESIEILWNDENTDKSSIPKEKDFENIVSCMADIYAPLVRSDIIDGLLNIYLYEIGRIDEMLEKDVKKLIRELRKKDVLEPFSTDEPDRVKILRAKLEAEKLRAKKRQALEDLRENIKISE